MFAQMRRNFQAWGRDKKNRRKVRHRVIWNKSCFQSKIAYYG
jgi:hypothetical protein